MQFLYLTGHKITRQCGFQNPRETAQKFNLCPGGLKICVAAIQRFVWMLGSCRRLICAVWESPPVFVTAQSLCVVTERRDTAVNNSFDNGSAPFKCYNGPNIFSKWGLILFSFFLACSDNKRRGRGAGSSRVCRRVAVMHQWQYSINPSYCIWIFGLCCFFWVFFFFSRTEWLTNCRHSVPVALCGQFRSQRVQDKGNKWHVPLHPANGFKSVSQKWSLWLVWHVGDFKVFSSPL